MSWAILSDLSGVEETPDGFGRFETREAALRTLVDNLIAERNITASKLKRATAALSHETKASQRRVSLGATTGKYATREELEAAIIAWRQEKVTMRNIARRAGVTYQVVYQITRKHRAKGTI